MKTNIPFNCMMIAKIKNIAKKITVNKFINNKLSIICCNLF
ncbi:hypothetical protein EU99_0153 [Prochlorococcus marinus str. MIT 9321]|uniref:Uncharacterized protein n=1 Tax=Prochlorococcus marinus str. MIT 9401 TaxID=167551 RepID=A0A0A2B1U1_PROMR|nr:hypothetical protein EU99_0153 [Prochlorococcus marinus str. MIT 9321]KGG06202.1 hypothetical protein EV00_0502 [Prochlorococcus marinus str. MIT 9322]KGG06775.1 hypothetical protein EV01_1980 [Prochlorococcus marinus str. MIT 9401]